MILEIKEVLTRRSINEDVDKTTVRNRHPNAIEYRYLKKDTSNRWITGYTPGWYNEEQEVLLMEEKQGLEDLANIKFNVNDPEDPFLSLLQIPLCLPNRRMPVFDTDVPLHLFLFRTALASGYIAPTKEEVGAGRFSNTTYYFEAKEVEDKKSKEISKLRLSAGAILSKNEDERAWLIIQCFLSGMIVKSTYENDTLFAFLAKELENCKAVKEVEALLKQFKRKNQEIEAVFISKKAVDLEIVKYDSITKEYVFTSSKSEGSTILGTSVKDVESYLLNPSKSPVFGEIRKEVYKVYKI